MASGDPFDFVGAAPGTAGGSNSDDVGVVCIHGFTGSPYEMRYLGEALARAGMTVRGPRLPGHGTSVDDLDQTRWQDWVGAVDREVEAMRRRCRQVALVGQSMGGLLALHAAATARTGARAGTPAPFAVASLAAPLWLDGLAGRVARWLTGPHGDRLRKRVPRLPKLGGSDVRDRQAHAENPSYPAVPTRALGELLALMQVVDAELPELAVPLLVLHASHDHTAPVACAQRIAARGHARRVRILPRSFHLIAIDVERTTVADEVTTFLRRHAAPPPGATPCAT